MNIAVLGASGSIGKQTIDIIENNLDYKLIAFSVGKNIEYANKIIEKNSDVELVCVQNKEDVVKINHENVLYGEMGLIEIAKYEKSEILLTAVVGSVGLKPTIEAIKSQKKIALANKETLVMAGEYIMNLAKKYDVDIIPVDSEHSAIFQSMQGSKKEDIDKIILTASGGSFREKTIDELKNVTVKEALNHPNWSMGDKITIDSATMFNKGLEVIEAHYLFDIDYKNIDVIIHYESIIHSMVEYKDGSVIAQLSTPNMRLPIQYALTYPSRRKIVNQEKINFKKLGNLTFKEVDYIKFKSLKLAYEAGESGGIMPTVLNAANEIAVDLYFKEKINFLEISNIVEKKLHDTKNIIDPTIEQILDIDLKVRKEIIGEYND